MIHFTRHVNGQLVVHESNEGIGQVRHAAPSRDIAKCAWSDFRVPDAPPHRLFVDAAQEPVRHTNNGSKVHGDVWVRHAIQRTMAWVDREKDIRGMCRREDNRKVRRWRAVVLMRSTRGTRPTVRRGF